MALRMFYKIFRAGGFTTWEQLFAEVCRFADTVGPERLVSISHSEDRNEGVVTVWYWAEE